MIGLRLMYSSIKTKLMPLPIVEIALGLKVQIGRYEILKIKCFRGWLNQTRLDRSTLTYTLITFHVHANQTTERTAFVIYMCNVPAIKHVGTCHKTGVRGLNVVKIYI